MAHGGDRRRHTFDDVNNLAVTCLFACRDCLTFLDVQGDGTREEPLCRLHLHVFLRGLPKKQAGRGVCVSEGNQEDRL